MSRVASVIMGRRVAVPLPARLWRRLLDVVLVVAAFGTGALRLQPWHPRLDLGFAAALVLTVSAVSMLWRRQRPATVFVVALLGNTLQLFAEVSTTISIDVGLVVGAYALAAHGRGPARVALPAAGVVPMAVAVVHGLDAAAGRYTVLAGAAAAVVSIGVPWLVGANVQARRRALTALSERAARLEVERELRAVRAVLDERGRIARELHDIVAHHVSVMGVQAGAARLAMAADPQRAEAALRTVESTARQAVGEMRRMLGVLRDPADAPPADSGQAGEQVLLSPQPGLADLPRLVGGFAETGMVIEMSVDWRLDAGGVTVADAVQLSAYRIVEQALTNVVEHAAAAPATVRVVVTADAVEVTVSNAAAPEGIGGRIAPAAGRHDRGHGTVGMRERVRMYDGVLNVGALPDGGYRVHARLPLAPR
ncbi:sensor histidine kinase [Actinoplanes cyaneus]|uniref:sensor histidine kinase n=1 Tax=Actinoplanes cyaneus TaxID=52696 RepID=UPI0031D6CCF7